MSFLSLRFPASTALFAELAPFHCQVELNALGLELLAQELSIGLALAVLKPTFEFCNLTQQLHFTGHDARVLENGKGHPVLAGRIEIRGQIQWPALTGKIFELNSCPNHRA